MRYLELLRFVLRLLLVPELPFRVDFGFAFAFDLEVRARLGREGVLEEDLGRLWATKLWPTGLRV
jgi:hypothetical protein